MNLEKKLRMFWIGKKKKAKEATIDYLEGLGGYISPRGYFRNISKEHTQEKIGLKHGVTILTIRKTIKKLSKENLLRHYCKNEDYIAQIELGISLHSEFMGSGKE